MALTFEGKTVLVTGGAGGLGSAIVKKFYESGATVYALDCNQEQLEKLKQQFPKILTVCVDLGDLEATETIVKRLGPLHHLVNNAAIVRNHFVPDVPHKSIERTMNINFTAPFNLSQVFAKNVIANLIKGATIVNVSSIADRTAVPGISAYSCSKAALSMLTKCLAVELGTHDIRVNAILPGMMATPMFAKSQSSSKEMEKLTSEYFERAPIKGYIGTADAANLVLYLSSPLSKMITGTCVPIDGGMSIT